MANKRPHGKRWDEATNTETVGHEWDGIEELNTPLPRWWLWTFYACIVFAIGYTVAYPGWPMIHKGTQGVLGWTSRGQLAEEMDEEGARKAPILAALAKVRVGTERIAPGIRVLDSGVRCIGFAGAENRIRNGRILCRLPSRGAR